MRNAYIHDFMEISHELLLSILVFDPLKCTLIEKMAYVTGIETESTETVIISKVKMLITAFVRTLKQWDKDISSPPYTLKTT